MRLSPPRPSASRAVEIGWLLETEKAGFIWEAPRRLVPDAPPPQHAKSVGVCPAVLDHEGRTFEIPCPIDLRLRVEMGPQETRLINVAGDRSSVRPKHLNAMLALVNRSEWRHPQRPLIQIITPYVFLSDEPVFLNQTPPFTWWNPAPWPGVMVGGRFPIDVWPRQLMWAMEWYDTSRELVLKRGDPWFYVRFETPDPSRPVRVFEAERTPELTEYMRGLSATANYVSRTYSLFRTARERRPRQLLMRKLR